MINQEYLDTFEKNLTNELLRLCTSYKMLDGTLLATDDIDGEWQRFAPEYIADAVKEISSYPTVSVAWAAYIGMAVAAQWDNNWEAQKAIEYKHYYGSQGFDDLDEHILFDLLKMTAESKEAKETEEMIRRCAQTTVSLIRHEQIEPQSPTAFYVFTRAAKTMYRIGAAIELRRLGYKFEKIDMPTC